VRTPWRNDLPQDPPQRRGTRSSASLTPKIPRLGKCGAVAVHAFEIRDFNTTVRLAPEEWAANAIVARESRGYFGVTGHWALAMHYVLIAFAAVVVVVFAWIALEAKRQFRRRSRAISQAVTRLPDDGGA